MGHGTLYLKVGFPAPPRDPTAEVPGKGELRVDFLAGSRFAGSPRVPREPALTPESLEGSTVRSKQR